MLKSEIVNGIEIISIEGTDKIISANAETFKSALSQRFDQNGIKAILDLQNISFLDSSGFSALLSALKKATINKGVFKICNVKTEVMRLFSLLNLDHVFEISDNMNECIASFDSKQFYY